MANEFKIKKGLIVTGASGGTVVDIQGSQGQLFSVTDNLSGCIFAVSDISGVPIFDVNSSGLSTFDGNVNLPDSKKILLGTGNDLEIYHDGSNSYIKDGGTGNLRIRSTSLRLENTDSSNMIVANGAGSVSLYYNAVKKFETTNTGVTVTGTAKNNGVEIESAVPSILFNETDVVANWRNRVQTGGYRIQLASNGTTFTDYVSLGANAFTLAKDTTFTEQAFSAATSSGDVSSTLTTKGYVDGLITGATIYRGTWQAGISATSTGTTSSSTTLTVSAAILDAAGNTPTLVGAVVTGAGITGTVKVASVTSSTVYELDTAISATATAYIFSPIYGAPDLSGVTQTSGYYYICSEAGSATPNGAGTEPNTWSVGDWVIWNDDIGTGEWQKVDNSSVLSGVGTGQTVALWEGPSSVTDSETLGNAPITVSGSNTTFAGTIDSGNIVVENSGIPRLTLRDSGNGGGGGASGKIIYSNTAGNAIGLGYTTDITTTSDFIISTDAGSTYGGYLGLDAAAIADPSNIILDPKTNVYITKALGIGVETPNDLLDIHNSAAGAVDAQMNFTTAATGTGTSDGFRVGWNGTVAQMYLFEDADMRFATNNSEKMTITSAGGISFGSTGTAYGALGQVLTSSGNASPTWTTPTTGTVKGSGTATEVAFWTANDTISSDDGLYWDNTNKHLGIGDITPGSKLKVVSGTSETSIYTVDINHVRNDANVSTNAVRINMDLSGADTTTADRTNYGLFLDIDSSANGDASNEHRIYGVGSFVNFTGFSDQVRGGYFVAESNYTGGKTAQLVGVFGNAVHDANDAAGGVSNMMGVYGMSSIQDTGDVDQAYGVYGLVSIGDNRVADVGVTKAVEGEILIDKSTAINYGTMIGISSIIDNNEGSVPNFGTQYLFKGDYQGTKGATAWGIYTEGDKNYFEGKIGIGTTTPDTLLDVSDGTSGATAPAIRITNTLNLTDWSSNTEDLGRFEFYTDDTSGSAPYTLGYIGIKNDYVSGTPTLPSGAMTFGTTVYNTVGGASEKMRLTSGGNLGIGTGADVYGDLHLQGGQQDIVLTNDNADGVANLTISRIIGQARGYSNDGSAMQSIDFVTNQTTWYKGDIVFKTNNTDGTDTSVAATEKMRIASNGNVGIGFTSPDSTPLSTMKLSVDGNTYVSGNVGIGTTSPSAKLHIDTGSDEGIRMQRTGTNANFSAIEFRNSDDTATNSKIGWNSNELRLEATSTYRVVTNSSDALLINSSGNVGIGETSPQAKLDIYDTFTKTAANPNTVEVFHNGNVTANNIYPVAGLFTQQVSGGANSFATGIVGVADKKGDYGYIARGVQGIGKLSGNITVNNADMQYMGVEGRIEMEGSNSVNLDDRAYSFYGTAEIDSGSHLKEYHGLYLKTPTNNGTILNKYGVSQVDANSKNYFAGNVGIGTTTPLAKLDIQGTQGQLFSVTDDLSGSIFAVADISGVPIFDINSSGVSYFDGNVGIGTDSPNQLLHTVGGTVKVESDGGNIAGAILELKHANNNTTDVCATINFTNNIGGYAAIEGGTTGANNTGYLSLKTDNAGVQAEGVRVLGGGAVQLSQYTMTQQTANSVYLLGVDSSGKIVQSTNIPSGTGGPFLPLTAGSTVPITGALYLENSNTDVVMSGNTSGNFTIDNNTGNIAFNANGSSVQSMVITSSQISLNERVAVNTTTMNSVNKLEVNGQTRVVGSIMAGNSSTANTALQQIHIKNSGTAGIRLEDSDNANLAFDLIVDEGTGFYISETVGGDPGDDVRFLIQETTGNVGIGGNTPSYLLDVRDQTTSGAIARFSAINPHVIIESSTAGNAVLHFKPNATGAKNGQFKVTAGNGYGFSWSNDAAGTAETAYMDLDTSTTGGGDLTVKGDVIAYGSPSDKKYKENIKPIESALDKAMQLQGVTFDWKDSESILEIKEDIGFIAQDVQEVLPELVRDNGKGNLSLRYQGITPILLEAIKELKAEIEELKKQIK